MHVACSVYVGQCSEILHMIVIHCGPVTSGCSDSCTDSQIFKTRWLTCCFFGVSCKWQSHQRLRGVTEFEVGRHGAPHPLYFTLSIIGLITVTTDCREPCMSMGLQLMKSLIGTLRTLAMSSSWPRPTVKSWQWGRTSPWQLRWSYERVSHSGRSLKE